MLSEVNLGAFLSFVFITTFTPGPNNISCASMGVLYGYRKTLPYIGGIMAGFFLVMNLCAFISSTMYTHFPNFEPALRLAGAAYILWLAYKSLKMSYTFGEAEAPLGFSRGFLLQALNPKGVVYGLTLFTTYLSPLAQQQILLSAIALFLTSVVFLATSTWAVTGAAIRNTLQNPQLQNAVNSALALLLAYTALELSGLFP